jgi:hypothetical protein
MSKGAINFNETTIEYYTPKSLADMFGKFDYDPATTAEQASRLDIPNYDTIETDGLKTDWTQYKRIWINPPFNIKHHFWDKACETYAKCRNEIYFLCPISFLTTKRFHKSLDDRDLNVYISLPNGRVGFINEEGKKSPAFGSVVVSPRYTLVGCVRRLHLDNKKEY